MQTEMKLTGGLVTGETITDEQIRQLYSAGHINHAEWANSLIHRDSRLGRRDRNECARIRNSLIESQ